MQTFWDRPAPRAGFIIRAKTDDSGNALVFAGLHIEAAKPLPVIPLLDAANAPFGALIGWPIDGDEWRLLGGSLRYERRPDDLEEFYRTHIRTLRGSFVAVLAIGGQKRLYLDPFGTLGVVYDPAARLAGGAASDILNQADYEARFDRDLHAALSVAGDGWFPAGLTAHREIERLLVNHYLDLEHFVPIRHETYRDVPAGSGLVADHLDTIINEIRGVTAALGKSGNRVAMGLTGGADSRLMLASLRDMTDKVVFYTVDAPGADFDRERSRELAERFGLERVVLPARYATPDQSEEWDARVGHAVATSNRILFPSVDPLEGDACIGGLGGEIGRCFLWRDPDRVPPQVEARHIIDRLKLPRLPILDQRIGRWLADLGESDPLRILDLAYIEQRMGPWGFAQSYANPRSLVLHPMGSDAAIRAMLALPPDYRAHDGMIRGVIERAWPELLDLPINRYGDFRDLVVTLRKLARPARVARKLRQLVRSR